MLAIIGIIVLIIISWPFIGGVISSLFNGIVIAVSLPFYWIMWIIKKPKDEKEEARLTNISASIAMIITVATLFFIMIVKI